MCHGFCENLLLTADRDCDFGWPIAFVANEPVAWLKAAGRGTLRRPSRTMDVYVRFSSFRSSLQEKVQPYGCTPASDELSVDFDVLASLQVGDVVREAVRVANLKFLDELLRRVRCRIGDHVRRNRDVPVALVV